MGTLRNIVSILFKYKCSSILTMYLHYVHKITFYIFLKILDSRTFEATMSYYREYNIGLHKEGAQCVTMV